MAASFRKTVALGALLGAFAAAPAFAQPDLVIDSVDVDESKISCDKGKPILVFEVFIKNQGTEDADFGAQRSVVGAAVDNAPYTWKLALTANDIDKREVEGYEIKIGEGDEKAGRIGEIVGGTAPFVPTSAREQNQLPRDLKVRIQDELIELGHLSGRADGDLGSGSRRAIRRFQAELGDEETGILTVSQMDELLRGGDSRLDYFGTDREFYIVVVVDPNSRIEESDESNNTEIFGPYPLEGC